jgi:hypothetical protein
VAKEMTMMMMIRCLVWFLGWRFLSYLKRFCPWDGLTDRRNAGVAAIKVFSLSLFYFLCNPHNPFHSIQSMQARRQKSQSNQRKTGSSSFNQKATLRPNKPQKLNTHNYPSFLPFASFRS